MFENWGPWVWVTISWLELLLAYGGYLFYLRRRGRKLEEQT